MHMRDPLRASQPRAREKDAAGREKLANVQKKVHFIHEIEELSGLKPDAHNCVDDLVMNDLIFFLIFFRQQVLTSTQQQ